MKIAKLTKCWGLWALGPYEESSPLSAEAPGALNMKRFITAFKYIIQLNIRVRVSAKIFETETRH